MSTDAPQPIYRKDYTAPLFDIPEVHLHFDLTPGGTQVKSLLEIRRRPNTPADTPLVLDGEHMALESILLNHTQLTADAYTVTDSSLTIHTVPDTCILEIVVTIHPENNTTCMGLYESRNIFCTQCESHGFRRITYFLDRPDVLARYTTTITADKTMCPYILSNGHCLETKELSNGRHWAKWEDPFLKPSYLFALVAGDLDQLTDTFTTQSGRTVDLQLFVDKGYAHQGHHALASLKRAMAWDEKTYGREYDLDLYMIVAVSDFNMGAMENKGLNVFNTSCILADPHTATDNMFIRIEDVVAHEYFHNWSGNRVTCRDWFQLTLKEGFTVFRDQQYIEDMTTPAMARLPMARDIQTAQFAEDAGPTSHPIRPDSYIEMNNFYTSTVYQKGSEVIRMMHTLLGAENFRKGTDLYFDRHDGQAVTADDFVTALEDASGRDLTQFRRWYSQSGTPVITVTDEYHADQQTYTLHITQHCPATADQPASDKQPLHMPLAIGLIGSNGQDIHIDDQTSSNDITSTQVLELTQAQESFSFNSIPERPTPSLLRGFSAPVKLHYDYSNEALLWLMQCDNDAFACQQASQTLWTRAIDSLYSQEDPSNATQVTEGLFDGIRALLSQTKTDPYLRGTLLQLPSSHYILQQSPGSDIQKIVSAQQALHHHLACALEPLWAELYNAMAISEPYNTNTVDIAKRHLRNTALHYLVDANPAEYAAWAVAQWDSSDNMTDQQAAVSALNNYPITERNTLLTAFYERWHTEPLVMCTWFSLQASSRCTDTFDTVQSLLLDPAYNSTNPNTIRALLGAFGANMACFHQDNNRPYHFMAEQVLAIDALNPQIAAGLIRPLIAWALYDAPRQTMMKDVLEHIMKQDTLSSDLYELVQKSIQQPVPSYA